MEENKEIERKRKIIENYNGRVALPYVIIVTFLVAFGLGLLSYYTFYKLDKRFDNPNVEAATDLNSSDESTKNSTGSFDVTYLESIVDILEAKYMGDFPGKNEANYEIVKGYIEALNDPYTSFLDPEEAKAYLENRSESFEGIGVTLGFNESNTQVESVLKNYPAEKAGILPKDYIIKVDEEDVQGKQPAEVAKLIRGEKGTEVKLTILRPKPDGTYEEVVFEVVRETIEVDNIMWKEVEDGIVEIDITQFIDDSVADFKNNWDEVVVDITEEVPELNGIIMDLRNNPGGYVLGVRYVAEEFLDQGDLIMQEESKEKSVVKYKDQRKGLFEDVPLVVIVNEGSASASEIFAAAVQENNRGEVVGMPTVGKGVEQELITLKDGSILIVVFQKWLTPNGNEITKEDPVKPDYEVEISLEEIQKGVDKQIDKALSLL